MLRILSSLRLFYALTALLAAAFLWQTLYNRGGPVYASPWFSALGLLLAANFAACTLRRARTAPLHFTLLHAGLVVVIAGSFATRLTRFEAGLPLRAGSASDTVYTDTAAYRLPFLVKLRDFRIEYYAEPRGMITLGDGAAARIFPAREGDVLEASGGEKVKVLRTLKDFGLSGKDEAADKSPYWHNPAVQLEIGSGAGKKRLWFFSNFPGMHGDLPFKVAYSVERTEIKAFVSSVAVKPPDGEEFRAEIAVNRPLRYSGYTLYQTSYDPADAAYSLLTVTRDRGVWVVYTGFALFLIGVLLWLRK